MCYIYDFRHCQMLSIACIRLMSLLWFLSVELENLFFLRSKWNTSNEQKICRKNILKKSKILLILLERRILNILKHWHVRKVPKPSNFHQFLHNRRVIQNKLEGMEYSLKTIWLFLSIIQSIYWQIFLFLTIFNQKLVALF